MRKSVSLLLVALISGLLLIACGDTPTATQAPAAATTAAASTTAASGATTAAASNSAAATLKIVTGDTKFLEIAQTHNKEFPNLKLDFTKSSWGVGGKDMREKELIMMSGGDAPDLGQMVWLKEFAKEDLLVDLTSEIKSWPIYSKLLPAQLDRMTYNGKIYGLTLGNNTLIQFYNKDILAKVGMTGPIKTLDQLQELSTKLKAANLKAANGKPVYTTSFEGGNWVTDYWLWAGGGKQMNDDYTKTLIDSPESIKAYSWMQDQVTQGNVPKPDGTGNQLWLNGQMAVWMSGTWDIQSTVDAKINYGVSTAPTGPTGVNYTGSGGVEFAIFKTSKHQKEAISFLKALASDENQSDPAPEVYVIDQTYFDNPIRQATWKKQGEGVLEANLTTRDQLKNAKYNFLEAPYVFQDGAKIYNDALGRILTGLEDPSKVMKDAATKINTGIADALKQ